MKIWMHSGRDCSVGAWPYEPYAPLDMTRAEKKGFMVSALDWMLGATTEHFQYIKGILVVLIPLGIMVLLRPWELWYYTAVVYEVIQDF